VLRIVQDDKRTDAPTAETLSDFETEAISHNRRDARHECERTIRQQRNLKNADRFFALYAGAERLTRRAACTVSLFIASMARAGGSIRRPL
jgi:hypothetical protein